ncbi:hypothetical protein [Burkholderia ubonensis]|nr:hypothetical protein [Burkholderia ubonensis]
MRYVLLERVAGPESAESVRRLLAAAGVTVICWRDRLGVVEFDGTATELAARTGGLPGWLVSEQRVYRFASVCGAA